MFWAISGRVLCVLGLLVAKLEQTLGGYKWFCTRVENFFPRRKRILHLPRF